MSSCTCARFDSEDGWVCSITGDRCEFYIPDSKKCAEMFGEGPDAEYPERDED